MRRPAQIALLGLALLVAACGSGEGPVEGDAYYDLVTRLGSASVEGETPAVLSALIDEKVALLQESAGVEEVTLSKELEEDLRSLGYLE